VGTLRARPVAPAPLVALAPAPLVALVRATPEAAAVVARH
jgi:hypothetical protein